MAGEAAVAAQGSARDGRIDLCRGLALSMILWSHSLFHCRPDFLPFFLAPSFAFMFDSAEVFIFLSGLVAGQHYQSLYARQGLAAMLSGVGRRVLTLYAANLATLVVVGGLGLWALGLGLRLPEIYELQRQPLAHVSEILALRYLPDGFDILPLYVVVMAGLPAILWLLRRSHLVAGGVMVALWLLPWVQPGLNLPRTPALYGSDGGWYFNPLSWQLMFYGGAWVAARQAQGAALLPRTRAGWVVVGSLALGLLLLRWGWVLYAALQQERLTPFAVQYFLTPPSFFPGAGKRLLEPLRVLHFAATAMVVVALLPSPQHLFWRHPLIRALVLLGRHSLPVFCVGTILSYGVGVVFAAMPFNPLLFWFCYALSWGLSLAAAAISERRDRR